MEHLALALKHGLGEALAALRAGSPADTAHVAELQAPSVHGTVGATIEGKPVGVLLVEHDGGGARVVRGRRAQERQVRARIRRDDVASGVLKPNGSRRVETELKENVRQPRNVSRKLETARNDPKANIRVSHREAVEHRDDLGEEIASAVDAKEVQQHAPLRPEALLANELALQPENRALAVLELEVPKVAKPQPWIELLERARRAAHLAQLGRAVYAVHVERERVRDLAGTSRAPKTRKRELVTTYERRFRALVTNGAMIRLAGKCDFESDEIDFGSAGPRFFEHLRDGAKSVDTWADAQKYFLGSETRRLVEDVEYMRKRKRARLPRRAGRARRASFDDGAVSLDTLHYRWRVVRAFLQDLHDGLFR